MSTAGFLFVISVFFLIFVNNRLPFRGICLPLSRRIGVAAAGGAVEVSSNAVHIVELTACVGDMLAGLQA